VREAAEKVQVKLYSSSLLFRFDREVNAYERMISAGVEDGIPRVLGFMRWTSSRWERDFPHILAHGTDVYALVTERLRSSSVMSSENICLDGAAGAVTSLDTIHRAGILHGNVQNNLLFDLPGRKATWVHFEDCRLPGEHTEHELETEMQYVLDLVYGSYVFPLDLQWLTIVGFA
jgi:hypothetical protein